ncbi:hypothetical protein [Halorubrum sp. CBA1125]|uniref:DUF5789 family protein n=1 Tax=Halorubrum sp. CBA1125 TaxID=2668072 RepID=UPI0037443297
MRFGPLKRALCEHRYPVTTAELIEQYGGVELETAAETERLDRVLERCEETTFREPWEVRDAILGALGETTVGEEADWSRVSP